MIKKNTLAYESKVWWMLSRHRLCPTTRGNILSSIQVALIDSFIAIYEFDIKELLAQEMRDRVMVGEKSLMVYTCMVTQLCLGIGVQEIPVVDEIIMATNITNLRLICDATKLMSRQVRKTINIVADMFQQSGQVENDETVKTGAQTKTT